MNLLYSCYLNGSHFVLRIFPSIRIRANSSRSNFAKASQRKQPHLQVPSHRQRDDIWHYNIAFFFSRLSRESMALDRISLVSLLVFPRFSTPLLLFRFRRRGGNWREPRRSTRREPLWRTVNPFRLFLLRPQAEKRGKGGEGPRWRVEKNQFSGGFFIGTHSCRRVDCDRKSRIRNWPRTANDEKHFLKIYFSNPWIN